LLCLGVPFNLGCLGCPLHHLSWVAVWAVACLSGLGLSVCCLFTNWLFSTTCLGCLLSVCSSVGLPLPVCLLPACWVCLPGLGCLLAWVLRSACLSVSTGFPVSISVFRLPGCLFTICCFIVCLTTTMKFVVIFVCLVVDDHLFESVPPAWACPSGLNCWVPSGLSAVWLNPQSGLSVCLQWPNCLQSPSPVWVLPLGSGLSLLLANGLVHCCLLLSPVSCFCCCHMSGYWVRLPAQLSCLGYCLPGLGAPILGSLSGFTNLPVCPRLHWVCCQLSGLSGLANLGSLGSAVNSAWLSGLSAAVAWAGLSAVWAGPPVKVCSPTPGLGCSRSVWALPGLPKVVTSRCLPPASAGLHWVRRLPAWAGPHPGLLGWVTTNWVAVCLRLSVCLLGHGLRLLRQSVRLGLLVACSPVYLSVCSLGQSGFAVHCLSLMPVWLNFLLHCCLPGLRCWVVCSPNCLSVCSMGFLSVCSLLPACLRASEFICLSLFASFESLPICLFVCLFVCLLFVYLFERKLFNEHLFARELFTGCHLVYLSLLLSVAVACLLRFLFNLLSASSGLLALLRLLSPLLFVRCLLSICCCLLFALGSFTWVWLALGCPSCCWLLFRWVCCRCLPGQSIVCCLGSLPACLLGSLGWVSWARCPGCLGSKVTGVCRLGCLPAACLASAVSFTGLGCLAIGYWLFMSVQCLFGLSSLFNWVVIGLGLSACLSAVCLPTPLLRSVHCSVTLLY